MANTAKMRLGFSPLTKKIHLAKMKETTTGILRRVGSEQRDVTNEAAQIVWQLVIAEGGVISWSLEDGNTMELTARLIKGDNNNG